MLRPMVILRIVIALAGVAIVVWTGQQAIRTFVVARAVRLVLNRAVFISMRRIFKVVVRLKGATADRKRRDAIMAHWAPLSLVALPGVWLVLAMIGYAAIFWAVDQHGVRAAIEISGSSLLTLGFAAPGGFGPDLIAFSEAAVGLGLIALVIAYLPSIYAAYSRRELVVAMLDARAGVPPNATQLVLRHHQYGGLARLDQKWNEWERWVVDIGQTHMTHPFLAFFRSATWDHSWLTSTATLLDAANLRMSAIMLPGGGNADASMYLTAATRVVRDIAGFQQIAVGHDGNHKLTPAEFNASLDELDAAGVPLDKDRRLIWERFAARRAKYEPAVLGLASLLDAAPAPWSSDRAPPPHIPPILGRRRSIDPQ
jgi:hypothetical protein